MKKLQLILLIIFGLTASMSLTSCSDKDELSLRNAKGVLLWAIDGKIDRRDVSLWINSEQVMHREDYEVQRTIYYYRDKNHHVERNCIPYYPMTISSIYEIVGYSFGIEINANTPKSQIPEDAQLLIEEIKGLRSFYQYIANYQDAVLLLTRLSDVEYY